MIDSQALRGPSGWHRLPAGLGCLLVAFHMAGCAAAPETVAVAESPPVLEKSIAVVDAPPEPTARTEEQLIAAVLVEDSVFFERGSIEIGEHGVSNLRLHAERLKASPKQRVSLIGYTENLGSRAYSVAIADQRVEAVYSMLRKFGVAGGQIRQRIAGVERNGKACNSEKCRRLMRRVELKYAKPRQGTTKTRPASGSSNAAHVANPES